MSHARNNRQDQSENAGGAPARSWGDSWPARLLLPVLLAILFCVFQRAPMTSYPPNPDGSPLLRGEFLLGWLVPDELAQQWLGANGSWALTERLLVVVPAAIIAFVVWMVGMIILWTMGLLGQLTRLERLSLSWIVGAQAVSLYTLFIGLLGGLNIRWLFVAPGAASMTLCYLLLRRSNPMVVDQRRQGDLSFGLPDVEPFSNLWLWLALPFVLVLFLGGMLPPVDFDVREYHLQVPKEWHQAGQIGFVPHNVYGNMPLGAEMFPLLGMCLVGELLGPLAGKLLLAMCPLATAVGLYSAGTRWHSRSAGVVASLGYVSLPWVVRVSTAGLIDAALAANLFFAWCAVARARDEADSGSPESEDYVRRWLIVAGWLAGAAVSCKYPAVLWVVVPLAAWTAWLRGKPRLSADPAIFLAAALVSCGPWLAKNLILTGNPTYPLLYELFGGLGRTPEMNAQWVAAHRPHGFSLSNLVGNIGQFLLWSEWQTPLVILLLSARGLIRRRSPHALALFVYIGFYLAAWWLLTHRIDRFWIPLLPLAVLLVGMRMAQGIDPVTIWTFRVFLALSLASNWIFCTLPGAGNDSRFLAPLGELHVDPLRVKRWHLRLNEEFQKNPEMKVLCIGEAMVFDLEMPIVYATVFDRTPWEEIYFAGKDQPRDSRAVLAALQERGITHVYVEWGEIARYRSPGNYDFPDFVTPESFASLVKGGALFPPDRIPDQRAEVYRVPKVRRGR